MANIIPMPRSIVETNDYFTFDKNEATCFISPELSEITEMLGQIMHCPFREDKNAACVSFIFDPDEEKESYSLIVDKSGARVFASCYTGAFYGLQTLRQLFGSDIENKKVLSSNFVKISNDSPRFGWRGLQLDESRHFFGKETVKKLLDFMAMYKLNVFHWHLTDDQGWRIEIKKYPLLTEIGSKRIGTQLKSWKCSEVDPAPVEGYYTHEDIKEIVAYAKKRCIDIIPEIDFPAHCAAALAAYNQLACREIPCEVPGYFGGLIPESKGIKNWNRPLCLGKDSVYEFVYEVLDEVAELFPFKYFHVGGDEAPRDEWKKCPACQAKMKKEGLGDETALQGYFTNCVNEHLKSVGKTLVGWNEVLAAKLIDRDVVAQYWTPGKDRNVTEHLKKGGKVILSCHKAFYFDMKYSYVSVKNAYTFDPTKNNVPKENLSGVLGLEGENWTEWTDSEEQLFFKLALRSLALSECAWTDENSKNYKDFLSRLNEHKNLLRAVGIYYGADEVTFGKNVIRRALLAKKADTSENDFDCEYIMSKKLDP